MACCVLSTKPSSKPIHVPAVDNIIPARNWFIYIYFSIAYFALLCIIPNVYITNIGSLIIYRAVVLILTYITETRLISFLKMYSLIFIDSYMHHISHHNISSLVTNATEIFNLFLVILTGCYVRVGKVLWGLSDGDCPGAQYPCEDCQVG